MSELRQLEGKVMSKKSLTLTIKRLEVLNKGWPNGVMLFANNGTLNLVDSKSLRIIETFIGISCDGGDATVLTKDDGEDYLDV